VLEAVDEPTPGPRPGRASVLVVGLNRHPQDDHPVGKLLPQPAAVGRRVARDLRRGHFSRGAASSSSRSGRSAPAWTMIRAKSRRRPRRPVRVRRDRGGRRRVPRGTSCWWSTAGGCTRGPISWVSLEKIRQRGRRGRSRRGRTRCWCSTRRSGRTGVAQARGVHVAPRRQRHPWLTKLDGTAQGRRGVRETAHDPEGSPLATSALGAALSTNLVPFSPREYVDGLFEQGW